MTPALVLLVPLLTGQAGGPPDADGGAKPTPAATLKPAPPSSEGGNGKEERARRSAPQPPATASPASAEGPAPGPGPALGPKSGGEPGAEPDPKTEEPAGRQRANAPEALPPALQAARARVADLESQVYELQAARQADQQRITALETELSDERSRREQAARSQEASAQALSTATDGLDQVGQALASGSGDVSAAMARAQALTGEAARHAGAGGSGQEAVLAGEAQRWLALSQEALQRGDLFQARVAVDAASRAATQARALAGR